MVARSEEKRVRDTEFVVDTIWVQKAPWRGPPYCWPVALSLPSDTPFAFVVLWLSLGQHEVMIRQLGLQ